MKARSETLAEQVRRLRGGTSVMVLAAGLAALLPGAALAQDAPAAQTDAAPTTDENAANADGQIIVTGQRRALQTAAETKRNADTVVDSISATDIGAFPDKSVAEALQRVPGITVNRFAASDDTSHFSADPSGVLIRGLTQVRSEFNGRDTFSANSSRGLSWGDISPELLAGVDTYKNATADLIEGGIAGTINLRTRLPFDQNDRLILLNVRGNIGDISGKIKPEISALASDRWNTGIGEIGVMLSGAWSQVQTESLGLVYGRTQVFKDVYGPGMQYIPSSLADRDTVYDRTRKGFSAALQWKDPSGRFFATAQYNRSEYNEVWREHGVIAYMSDLYNVPADMVYTAGNPKNPKPAPGTGAFVFDEDGNFVSGTLNNQQTDYSWWGASDADAAALAVNSSGQNMMHPCYSWGPANCGVDARGLDVNAVTRYNESNRMTQDASLNLKWEATDRLSFNFDAQYVDSTLENYDVEVGQYSFANVTFANGTSHPTMTFSAPTNVNQSPGALSNPNNYRYNHAMDHYEKDNGTEWAFRADGSYDIKSDWVDSLKFGLRYADRDQTVRYSAYNWGNITNNWNLGSGQSRYWNIDSVANNGFKGYPSGVIDVRNFGGDFFGGTNQFVFFNMDALQNRGVNGLSYSALGVGQDQWEPVCSNGGSAHTGPRTAEIPGTCFTPGEIGQVSETTKAAYVMLKWGGPNAYIGGDKVTIRGNIGLRYVETRDKVAGSTVYPVPFGQSPADCARRAAAGGVTPATPYTTACYLFGNASLINDPTKPPPAGFTDFLLPGSPAALAFNNGAFLNQTADTTHHNWLPSFNMRIDFDSKWLMRFAVSRAMSRPDIGLLKNYVTVTSSLPADDANDPRWVKDSTGRIIGIHPGYQASSYNPRLKPITATQLDLTVENYFSKTGSFSLAGFYKAFENYIQYGSHYETFTNNGVTETIEVRGPVNGKGAKIYGIEGAFQTFFDFLPKPFDGLGVQLNGTYVENNGIVNTGLKAQNGSAGGSVAQAGTGGTTLTVDSLEGLSKWTFNAVGMYEKGPLAIRLAYNWRSKFLMTAVDCCTYLPIWQKATGVLDGSIRYALTPNLELSIEGSNLLNTTTVLEQQVTNAEDGALLRPNAWFHNDRRFIFGARMKF